MGWQDDWKKADETINNVARPALSGAHYLTDKAANFKAADTLKAGKGWGELANNLGCTGLAKAFASIDDSVKALGAIPDSIGAVKEIAEVVKQRGESISLGQSYEKRSKIYGASGKLVAGLGAASTAAITIAGATGAVSWAPVLMTAIGAGIAVVSVRDYLKNRKALKAFKQAAKAGAGGAAGGKIAGGSAGGRLAGGGRGPAAALQAGGGSSVQAIRAGLSLMESYLQKIQKETETTDKAISTFQTAFQQLTRGASHASVGQVTSSIGAVQQQLKRSLPALSAALQKIRQYSAQL